MSPFQNSHQPTHAGQPAGAFNFAPDEEPIASSFDGAGPPFDVTVPDPWMDFWDPESSFQSAFDPSLNDQAMLPPFHPGAELLDWTPNDWADETFGLGTAAPSQSGIGPTLNEQIMLPPFDSTLWVDQPLEQVASTSALFPGQAPGAPSYLQDAPFDRFHASDWTNDDAGMPDALGGLADPRSYSPFIVHCLAPASDQDDMAPLRRLDPPNVTEPIFDASPTSRTPAPEDDSSHAGLSEYRNSRQLKCGFEQCTHKGKFRRRWELERHMKAKHRTGAGLFRCRATGCYNKQLPWTFSRSDKLTAHIKAMHTRDTVFTACPVGGCGFGPHDLETLGVHIERAHKSCKEGRAVLNASTCKVRKCPLWRCGKHVTARKLLSHVAGHVGNEVLAATSKLESEGLVVLPSSDSSQPDHELVITVQCPVCNTMSNDVDDFITHFWTSHLFLPGSGGAEHFVAWKEFLMDLVWHKYRDMIKDGLPWIRLDSFEGYIGIHEGVECPSCGLVIHNWDREAVRNEVSAHHLSLLRPEAEVKAELRPYRMQILRLYPEFVSHPVFADFDQPQDGITSSSQEPSDFDGTGLMESVDNHRLAMMLSSLNNNDLLATRNPN